MKVRLLGHGLVLCASAYASLQTSMNAGSFTGMDDSLRKITVEVPAHDLEMAQAYTGEGVTETVRVALKKLASIRAQQELLKLRGTYKFKLSLDELREDRKW
jgi:hypothetical protein